MHGKEMENEHQNRADGLAEQNQKIRDRQALEINFQHVKQSVNDDANNQQPDRRARLFRPDIKARQYENMRDKRIQAVHEKGYTAGGKHVQDVKHDFSLVAFGCEQLKRNGHGKD